MNRKLALVNGFIDEINERIFDISNQICDITMAKNPQFGDEALLSMLNDRLTLARAEHCFWTAKRKELERPIA